MIFRDNLIGGELAAPRRFAVAGKLKRLIGGVYDVRASAAVSSK